MVKPIWSILCRSSSIDSETNNLSIRDELESLIVDVVKPDKEDIKYPINIPFDYEVVTLWYLKDTSKLEKFIQRIEILDPEGKLINNHERNLEVPIGNSRFRSRAKITGFSIPSQGTYWFVVSYKSDIEKSFHKVAEIPFDVKLNIHVKE